MRERTIGLLLVAVVALGAMTGAVAADGHLEVAVEDADGEPTVTVTENDTAVENATVNVTVADGQNAIYDGAGEYETDENGTVELPAAEEDVKVNVTSEYDNETATTSADLEAPDGLELDVENTDGEPVVTVTDNDTAVENASVNVTTADDQNATYADEGGYETDENGTVTLDAAEEDVTVNVTTEHDNETVTTSADLEAPTDLAVDVENTDGEPVVTVTDNDTAVENASVNVTTADGQNATYVGEGDYETDENGTVTLDAAEENVTVDVTATVEDESVSTTADLTAGDDEQTAEEQPFGQLVQDFVDQISDREGGIGASVSDFVTENNPGNAPDHAGNPGGPNASNGSDAGAGNGNAPDHAGQGNDSDGEQGPRDHAGQGNDSDATDTEEDDGEAGTDESDGDDDGDNEDDSGNGGNGNAGNGQSNGNGNGNGNGGGPP